MIKINLNKTFLSTKLSEGKFPFVLAKNVFLQNNWQKTLKIFAHLIFQNFNYLITPKKIPRKRKFNLQNAVMNFLFSYLTFTLTFYDHLYTI